MRYIYTKFNNSKPMALPARAIGNQPTSSGYEKIDEDMDKDTANIEQQIYPDIKYLNSGGYGAAYDCKPGVVCKYTNDYHEYVAVLEAMKNPIPCIAKIFNIRKAQIFPPIWVIETEKVTILSKDEKYNWDAWLREGSEPESIKYSYLSDAYFKMLYCLQQHDYNTNDMHGDNVGWNDEGELVLFDLGLSKNPDNITPQKISPLFTDDTRLE